MGPPFSIAHYKITAKVGEGGVGEVWRATDTKLGCDVAIKVLPESFARDGDRMARFEREAKALAALNHPNIAQIYGVEERALVMELVEGEPLRGPLPLKTALDSAQQIAEVLEAAREKGIPLTPHIPCIRIEPVRQRAQGRVCDMEEPVPARFRHSCLYRKANKLGLTSGLRHGKALEPAVYRREKRGRCVPGPSTGDFKFVVPGREPAGAKIGGVQIWASLESWPFASDANGSSGVEPQWIGG
jgi:hypothetical protein